ncbi:MAG TPA: hypothetical protein PKA77_12220 [Chitinophagaceae bacterium]|jgi:preprotein translocase subunit SecG|nr:hypothetical protein [Chitinophagaceae bacterium]HMU56626.1 hypothetical protein [Chitinophagaceae bacterium]
MANQLKKFTAQLFLGTFVFSLLLAACNNSSDKKEPAADTLTPKVEQPAPVVNDTPANTGDTGVLDTRPVKTTD